MVDPDGVRAQAEGSIMDGMATAFHWQIPYRGGRVLTTNFDRFPLLRATEAPAADVMLVPSGAPPTGVGEPPYPSVPPAITAALFAATGRRYRRLPVRDD